MISLIKLELPGLTAAIIHPLRLCLKDLPLDSKQVVSPNLFFIFSIQLT
jgi:hypothetical protein